MSDKIVQRVRAILLTGDHKMLFIKRIKTDASPPYWVAPGGGVESEDDDIFSTLHRELLEELGAHVEILREAFVLRHEKAGKNLQEHFFICRLIDYDLALRHGPEFNDPSRGEYLPDFVPLEKDAIAQLNIKTEELGHWLMQNLSTLNKI